MYTSRNYLYYRRYNPYTYSYEDEPLEVLKQRRADKIKMFRKLSWLQRLVAKVYSKLIRESLSKQGFITKEGVYNFEKM